MALDAFKIGERQSVRSIFEFGAVGDGATDDAKAFNDAFKEMGRDGGTLYLPPGYTFLIQKTLFTFGTVSIVGYGATIRFGTNTDALGIFSGWPYWSFGIKEFWKSWSEAPSWSGRVQGVTIEFASGYSDQFIGWMIAVARADFWVFEDVTLDTRNIASNESEMGFFTNLSEESWITNMPYWTRGVGAPWGNLIGVHSLSDVAMTGKRWSLGRFHKHNREALMDSVQECVGEELYDVSWMYQQFTGNLILRDTTREYDWVKWDMRSANAPNLKIQNQASDPLNNRRALVEFSSHVLESRPVTTTDITDPPVLYPASESFVNDAGLYIKSWKEALVIQNLSGSDIFTLDVQS